VAVTVVTQVGWVVRLDELSVLTKPEKLGVTTGAVPYVVDVGDAVMVREALVMVTVVGEEDAALYVESAAFVTVTVHVPALVAVNDEPVMEHPAVPTPVT
jgi:hypothetical protein